MRLRSTQDSRQSHGGPPAGTVTVASDAPFWAAMLTPACIKDGVIETKLGSEGLCHCGLRGTRAPGEPAPATAPTEQHQAPPHPQIEEPFYSPEFSLLVKMFGSLENFPNNPRLC